MTKHPISTPALYNVVLLLALSVGFGGCARLNSIYRTPNLNSGESVITDAKQRIITNHKVQENKFFVGRVTPQNVICTEPSPDVAQSVSTAISASLEAAMSKGAASQNVAGAFGLSSADSIAQLGERIATIQLLRDELSDLCRAYANGAVSATTYSIRLSKLDKKMVTLLISETSAGAFGRHLAAIGSVATAGTARQASPEEIKKARERVDAATKALGTKQKAVDDKKKEISDLGDKPDAKALEPKQVELRAAEKERDDALLSLHTSQAELYGLLAADVRTTANGMPASDIGTIPSRSGSTSMDAALIQKQFLDVDELSTVVDACLTSMDILRVPGEVGEDKLESTLSESRTRRSILEVDYFNTKNQLSDLESQLKSSTVAPFNYGVIERRDTLQNKLNSLRIDIEAAGAIEKSTTEAIDRRRSSGDPLSTLGKTCVSNFPQILQVIGNQALRGERHNVLAQCGPVLDGTRPNADDALKTYCKKAFDRLSDSFSSSVVSPPRPGTAGQR